MRKRIISLFIYASFFILLINLVCATNNYEIKFTQLDKKIVAEILLLLDSEQEIEFTLPSDIQGLSANLHYTKENNILKIRGKEIKFSYVTSDYINKVNNEYYFVKKIQIPTDCNIKISLVLDEGLVLNKEDVFPQTSRIETDGRKISVDWEMQNQKSGESIPIFVTFENPNQTSIFLIIFLYFIGFLVIIFLGKIGYNKFIKNKVKLKEGEKEKEEQKPKVIIKKVIKIIKQTAKETKEEKKNKEIEEIERHLLDEERKILEELRKADRNEMWQKQLQLNLSLSKAKTSRLIRNLEARNLITKIPFGNTNKIVLK